VTRWPTGHSTPCRSSTADPVPEPVGNPFRLSGLLVLVDQPVHHPTASHSYGAQISNRCRERVPGRAGVARLPDERDVRCGAPLRCGIGRTLLTRVGSAVRSPGRVR